MGCRHRLLGLAQYPLPCGLLTCARCDPSVCFASTSVSMCAAMPSLNRLFDRTLCTALYEEMIENPEAVVLSVRENVRRKWKPIPLGTVAMQTLASRKLGMSSAESLKCAEDLYLAGFIRCVVKDVIRSRCGYSRDVLCAISDARPCAKVFSATRVTIHSVLC